MGTLAARFRQPRFDSGDQLSAFSGQLAGARARPKSKASDRWSGLDFELPGPPTAGVKWCVAANTAMPSPDDIDESGQEVLLSDQSKVCLCGRSVMILVAR